MMVCGILRQGRSHIGALIGKGDRDFATDVDLQIETAIRASLAEAAPGIPLLGEEEGGEGAGAYLNGNAIAITEVGVLKEAIVGLSDFKVGAGAEDENRVHLAVLARLARESLRVRMHGSAALDLAWLAAGRLNATVMLSNLRDVTAGLLLVREAGGCVYDYDGSRHNAQSVEGVPPVAERESYVRADVELLRERTLEAIQAVDPRADIAVHRGRPADSLLELSANVDLIVSGSRRWGLVARLLLGSTGEAVLHDAGCPILIAPRPGS